MDLFLYNSLTRKKDLFSPNSSKANQTLDYPEQDCIKMYVCGPTVYDFAHLGNARAMVVFDVLFRLLKLKYQNVIYIRNITDIDDKIYLASIENKCHFSEIAKKYEKCFLEDMVSLNVLSPTHMPKATDFIPEIITFIQKLISKDFAYESNGHVLFNVNKYSDYGKLSSKNKNDLLAGARVEIGEYKNSPNDFVLWKPSEGDQPAWESPFGLGRPGWHIECSAMSYHYLGGNFDIHGGGIDLIFPHHENERAQSCCALDVQETANFWLHNGHLMINGKKMSKSLGNFLTIRNLLNKYNPEAIRLTLLSTHYRQPFDWLEKTIDMTKQVLNKWYRILDDFEESEFLCDEIVCETEFYKQNKAKIYEASNDFLSAIHDDMNTPLAIQCLGKMFSNLEKEKGEGKGPTLEEEVANWKERVKGRRLEEIYIYSIYFCAQVLGIFFQKPQSWFKYNCGEVINIETAKIEEMIRQRNIARGNKDFKLSDDIRDELIENGIILEDSKNGTTWRKG